MGSSTLLAGHDNTGNVVTRMWYQVARYLALERCCHDEEIVAVLGDGCTTAADLPLLSHER